MTLGFLSKRLLYQNGEFSKRIDQGKVHATLQDESGAAMIIRLFEIRIDGTHPSDSINSRFLSER